MTTEPTTDNVVHVGGEDHSTPLSDYDINLIHAGLLIPNAQAIRRMAREIRSFRGNEHQGA